MSLGESVTNLHHQSKLSQSWIFLKAIYRFGLQIQTVLIFLNETPPYQLHPLPVCAEGGPQLCSQSWVLPPCSRRLLGHTGRRPCSYRCRTPSSVGFCHKPQTWVEIEDQTLTATDKWLFLVLVILMNKHFPNSLQHVHWYSLIIIRAIERVQSSKSREVNVVTYDHNITTVITVR